MEFFFLFAAVLGWVTLPWLPDYWSLLQLHLVCCWTALEYFLIQLMYSSALWLVWYFLIPLCWSSHWVHSSPKPSKHLYDHYFMILLYLPGSSGRRRWMWDPSQLRVSTMRVGFWARLHLCLFYLSQCGPFNSLLWNSCLAGFQVLFRGNGSIGSCRFGVSIISNTLLQHIIEISSDFLKSTFLR